MCSYFSVHCLFCVHHFHVVISLCFFFVELCVIVRFIYCELNWKSHPGPDKKAPHSLGWASQWAGKPTHRNSGSFCPVQVCVPIAILYCTYLGWRVAGHNPGFISVRLIFYFSIFRLFRFCVGGGGRVTTTMTRDVERKDRTKDLLLAVPAGKAWPRLASCAGTRWSRWLVVSTFTAGMKVQTSGQWIGSPLND